MSGSLVARNLGFNRGARIILEDVSFVLKAGALTALLGPNGAGKTTLMRLLLGLLKPFAGAILLDAVPINILTRRQLARRIAYVPQGHVPAFPFSVAEIVAMGRTPARGWGRRIDKEDEAAVRDALHQVGMSEFATRSYAALSGGERQSVLIARALAQDADILILDEPAASLDFGQQTRLMRTLQALAGDGKTILLSVHNIDLALRWCNDCLVLKDGRLLAEGTPGDTLTPKMLSCLYGVQIDLGQGGWMVGPSVGNVEA